MAANIINEKGGYVEYAGTSTDEKPTEGVATGSIFTEVDTGNVYFYNADDEEWVFQFSFQSSGSSNNSAEVG